MAIKKKAIAKKSPPPRPKSAFKYRCRSCAHWTGCIKAAFDTICNDVEHRQLDVKDIHAAEGLVLMPKAKTCGKFKVNKDAR